MKLLTITTLLLSALFNHTLAQQVPYGNNPETGDYFDAGGVNLYYEVYGKGSPILLLHGGVYGYIDEFGPLIPRLVNEGRQVICLATRGHVKSEVGDEPLSWEQRADDAYKMLRHLNIDSATVIGFSDGGQAALTLAARYPEAVTRVVAMGVGYFSDKNEKSVSDVTSEILLKQAKAYFEARLKLMPDPSQWEKSLQMLNDLYNNKPFEASTLESIKCKVLFLNGERDGYFPVKTIVKAYELVPNSSLAIIPDCHHVVFHCNLPAVWESMAHFIK